MPPWVRPWPLPLLPSRPTRDDGAVVDAVLDGAEAVAHRVLDLWAVRKAAGGVGKRLTHVLYTTQHVFRRMVHTAQRAVREALRSRDKHAA